MTPLRQVIQSPIWFVRKSVILLLALATSLPTSAATYIIFRYDDLAADPPGVREINRQRQETWDAECAMDELFASHGLPYVVGIIPNADAPFNTDTAKVSFVRQAVDAGRMQVALHGFIHANHAGPNGRASEFNRDFPQQLADVTSGLALLKEATHLDRITTFIPPFNDWNENTAQALVRTGFQILSADRYKHSATADHLTVVPFTAQLWELESRLTNGPFPDGSIVVVILHPPQIANVHNYDGRYFGLARLKTLLDKIVKMPDLRVVTFDQLVHENLDLPATRYAAAVGVWRWRTLWDKLLPERYWPGISNAIMYDSEAAYNKLNIFWTAITSAVILFIVTASALVAKRVLANRTVIFVRVFLILSSLAVLAGSLLIWNLTHRGFHVNGLRLFPLCGAIGVFIASIGQLFWPMTAARCNKGKHHPS